MRPVGPFIFLKVHPDDPPSQKIDIIHLKDFITRARPQHQRKRPVNLLVPNPRKQNVNRRKTDSVINLLTFFLSAKAFQEYLAHLLRV